ncbi:MAG TPA: type II secretion system protein GspM [Bryobacteraceae bacterium]|nr:type II secretion system protein GspM [Bryobacteraceae bacterium]
MTVGTLDRRTLLILLGGLAGLAILRFGVYGDKQTDVVMPADSIPVAEKRLERLRQVAATIQGKETVMKQAAAELAEREKGILKADTASQAQAQLLDVIRQVASANGIDARGAENMRQARLGNDYGEVSVAVTFTCGVDQLVNFLAAIANEPQILATNEIHISGGTDKKKNVQVRLDLSGVVPRKLIPEKKGMATF